MMLENDLLKGGFLLAGKWTVGTLQPIHSPYDGGEIRSVHMADRGALQSAIAAADQAFAVTRRLPAYERQRVLKAVSDGIRAHADHFARTMALEAGKPLKAARIEVERAIFTFAIAAQESGRIAGEVLPMDLQSITEGRWGLVRRFPVGPISAITPFNFPLNLVAHKVAPAMAAGCSVVLKPAPQTPFCALMLGELVRQAGWPAGGLSILPLANEDADALICDDRLKVLSFTGSSRVGWQLKAKSGKKRVLLELGGNAAVVVHHDAELEAAAERCAVGGFSYAGQSCISVQRILVQQQAYKAFTDLLVERVKALKIGDPLHETTDVGPMIRESDAKRAELWIREAVGGGAKLLCGAERRGSTLTPAVLTGTTPEMKVNCEEIFAPVVTVEPYSDPQEALNVVNDSPYGLQAGIFTNDARLIFHAYEQLEVGGLIVNDVPTFRIDHMPYGGVKDSGLGREGVRYAIEEMTERKLLVMRN
jgi:acyl-CoA reductase-like NAD-dependent aldehyde dehydrogenase